MQYARIRNKVLVILSTTMYLLMLTGCSESYQGERINLSPTMLQEINNMSTDEAVGILKLYFQKEAEKYASVITSEEWKRMKDEMNSKPWLERQLTTANLNESSRRKWHEWVATTSAIVHRIYLEDYSHWVKVSQTRSELQRIPPETEVTEFRYTDVIELRTVTNNNGKRGLRLYCDTKNGSGYSFWSYPDDDKDLEPLTRAFIKLCPNIRKYTIRRTGSD